MMSSNRTRPFAFSLVELLAVIAVIAILSTLAMSSVGGMLGSLRIGQAGSSFTGIFSNARQLAVTRSRPVSVWLVGPDANTISGAITFLRRDDGTDEPVSKITKLPDGIALSTVATLSPLLTAIPSKNTNTPPLSVGSSATYAYRVIEFRPDGSLAATGTNLFFTLVPQKDIAKPTPANYATIWLERRTGAVRNLRP